MDFDELKACASIIRRHGASVEILLHPSNPSYFTLNSYPMDLLKMLPFRATVKNALVHEDFNNTCPEVKV